MSFDKIRYYREVDVMREGFRETVHLQKTGVGADQHVYLKGHDIGSIEKHDGGILVHLPGPLNPRTGKATTAVRRTEQDALNLLLDLYEQDHPPQPRTFADITVRQQGLMTPEQLAEVRHNSYAHLHQNVDHEVQPFPDTCGITEHNRREVLEGTVTPVLNPRPRDPRTYLLTASMGILTGLAPSEQDFIDQQPPGTKVGLVREMFAFSPEHVDPGPEPDAQTTTDPTN